MPFRLLLLLALVAPRIARAQSTYYVDAAAGDDQNAGTDAAPWATLQRAADAVAPGDTVIVRAGTYRGMYLSTSGTAEAPIMFRAEDGAIVDQDNDTTADGINLEGASHVIVEGFEVIGVTRAGIRAVLCSNVVIRNNVLDQNGRWGVLTGFCDDITIEGNQASRSEIEHGIYVSNSGDRPVIRNNRIFGNNANGIHMNGDLSQGGDGVISEAIVEGNIIWDNGAGGGSGINCDGVQRSIFRNNLIYDTHASGVSFYQIDGGEPSRDNLLVNNTIVVAANGRWALNIQNASTGNRVFNNILVNLHSFRGSVDISADSLTGFTSDHNVVLDRFTVGGGGNLTLAEWRAMTGQDENSVAIEQGDISTDGALFVAPSAGDHHLAPNSAAIDRGRSEDAPAIDLDGIARPQGAGIDIGAYERCAGDCGAPPPVDAGIDDAAAEDASNDGGAIDGAAPDAGTTSDAGAIAEDAGTSDAGVDEEEEGCGCNSARPRGGSRGWLLLWIGCVVLRRRRSFWSRTGTGSGTGTGGRNRNRNRVAGATD